MEERRDARHLEAEIELVGKTITLIEADKNPPKLRYVIKEKE